MTKLNIGDKFQATWKDGTTEKWELAEKITHKDGQEQLNLIITESAEYESGVVTGYHIDSFLEGLKDGSIKKIQ